MDRDRTVMHVSHFTAATLYHEPDRRTVGWSERFAVHLPRKQNLRLDGGSEGQAAREMNLVLRF